LRQGFHKLPAQKAGILKRLYHSAGTIRIGQTITKFRDMKKFYFILIVLFVVNGAKAQWMPLNSGTTNDLYSVCFTDANTGYAAGESGIVLKTTDGTVWTNQVSGTDSTLRSICFPAENTGYVVGHAGTILKTTNGGTNWNAVPGGTEKNLLSAFFINIDTGFAVGDSGIILKTNDGGSNWTVQYMDSTAFLTSVHFPVPDTGYAVGYAVGSNVPSYGKIFKTVNGGTSWRLIYVGLRGTNFRSVCFTDALTGYVGYSGIVMNPYGAILKTTDGGNSFSSNGGEIDWQSIFFLDSDTGYAAGSTIMLGGGAILKTTDGGTNWTNQLKISTPLASIFFIDETTGYAVGDSGKIMKTINGGVGIDNHNQTVSTLPIYPNPASTSITIENSTAGSLSVLNLQGQQLLQQEISGPNTTVDVSSLPCGVYFVRLTGEKTVQVRKIIKQ
jgi:photosystem II stability/assembly factor-like uncharacterized protein